MSTFLKISGYEDRGNRIGQQALTSDQMKALLTRKKVEKAFVFHYASTFASFFYSIYTCIPTYKFSQSHRKNALLLTMFMSTSLILHIFFKNRQNPYRTIIQNLCKEKLRNNQFTAFQFQEKYTLKSYAYSKSKTGEFKSHVNADESYITKHFPHKTFKEIFLKDLIPNE